MTSRFNPHPTRRLGALVTMAVFPLLLLAFIVIIAGGFILGYLAGAFWIGVRNMPPQNLISIIAILRLGGGGRFGGGKRPQKGH